MPYDLGTFIEVRSLYVANGQKCMNVYHYAPVGDSSGWTDQTLLDAFADAQGGNGNGTLPWAFTRIMAVDVQYYSTTFQIVFPKRLRGTTRIVTMPGIRLGNCDAQNVQASLTKLGPEANRANQGGMRVGGLASNDYAAGFITADFSIAFEIFRNEMSLERLDAISPVNYVPCIANKEPIPGTDPVKFRYKGYSQPLIWVAQTALRTLTRRTIGRGE